MTLKESIRKNAGIELNEGITFFKDSEEIFTQLIKIKNAIKELDTKDDIESAAIARKLRQLFSSLKEKGMQLAQLEKDYADEKNKIDMQTIKQKHTELKNEASKQLRVWKKEINPIATSGEKGAKQATIAAAIAAAGLALSLLAKNDPGIIVAGTSAAASSVMAAASLFGSKLVQKIDDINKTFKYKK